MDLRISGQIRIQRGRQGQLRNCWRREGQQEDRTAWDKGPSGGAQWEALDTEGNALAKEEEEEEKRVGVGVEVGVGVRSGGGGGRGGRRRGGRGRRGGSRSARLVCGM